MKDNTERINELAVMLKNGDKSVFDELYSLTCSKAYFIALQISGDEHEAEDIVQDSYVTVLSKISDLEKTESFMSWFNRIVANRSKDYLKKRKPKVFSDDEEKAFTVIADEKTEFSPESNVDREELRSAVMEAIKELGAEKRACVLMRYFDDMSVNEIAESMEMPVSTIKNRLLYARRDLKKLFERKGITAAYSVAPFGIITWALNSSFDAFSQSFESSASAAKILSGIAVASTAAAATGTAAATATATGTGIAAKAAAATTAQKIISGIVVAGVVTGSTVGITSVVRNKKQPVDDVPTTSYSETVESNDIYEPETTPVVNVLNANLQENGEEYENKVVDFENPGIISEKIKYKGNLKLGDNHVDFEDGVDTYYVNFKVDKPGYYLFTCNREDTQNFSWIFVSEDSQSGQVKDFYTAEISSGDDHGQLEYFEADEHTLLVSRNNDMESTDISVEYFGEEITDIVINQEDLDNVVLGYNENYRNVVTWHDQSIMEEGAYGNWFRMKIVFSSGKVYDRGYQSLRYRVKDGGELKEGKNTVIFAISEYYGIDKEFVLTARPVEYYVKDIKVSNLDEFKAVKINEEGFIHEQPEDFDVTVTYADGTKETFDGATWDRILKFDKGVELYVTFCRARETGTMDYRLRSREPLHFRVSIGETDYIDEICTVTEFDVIGYRKRLDENNLEEAMEYTVNIEEGIEQMKENTDSLEDFLWYSTELSKVTAYNSYKIANRIAGFELDYAITTYKILTENEFDLF